MSEIIKAFKGTDENMVCRVSGDDGKNHEQKYELNKEYRDWETDRKSTLLNSSHRSLSRMPSSA